MSCFAAIDPRSISSRAWTSSSTSSAIASSANERPMTEAGFPSGRRRDPPPDARIGAPEQLADEPADLALGEGLELDRLIRVRLRPVGVPLAQLMPSGAQDEDRRALGRLDEVVDE